jgi:hypothetical protein
MIINYVVKTLVARGAFVNAQRSIRKPRGV